MTMKFPPFNFTQGTSDFLANALHFLFIEANHASIAIFSSHTWFLTTKYLAIYIIGGLEKFPSLCSNSLGVCNIFPTMSIWATSASISPSFCILDPRYGKWTLLYLFSQVFSIFVQIPDCANIALHIYCDIGTEPKTLGYYSVSVSLPFYLED